MNSTLNPYLNFRGSARQAMEFYKGVFGGKLQMSTFKEFQATKDPVEENWIMHAELKADNGITFMGSDVPKHIEYKPVAGFSMSLSGPHENERELRGYFEKLSAGGKIMQPLSKAPWGDTFGMFVDRFGVSWLVNISAPK
jgi:PhnB protein